MKGMSAGTDGPLPDGSVVVGPEEVADCVLGRARATRSAYSEDQVAAVLDAQMGYLEAIGAIGPEATPDELGQLTPALPAWLCFDVGTRERRWSN